MHEDYYSLAFYGFYLNENELSLAQWKFCDETKHLIEVKHDYLENGDD